MDQQTTDDDRSGDADSFTGIMHSVNSLRWQNSNVNPGDAWKRLDGMKVFEPVCESGARIVAAVNHIPGQQLCRNSFPCTHSSHCRTQDLARSSPT